MPRSDRGAPAARQAPLCNSSDQCGSSAFESQTHSVDLCTRVVGAAALVQKSTTDHARTSAAHNAGVASDDMSAAQQREFDIVLYGATGFVGKLTAEYLAKAGGDARIALAGRSQDRLTAVRDTLGESAQSWPVVTADAASPSTLTALAARTQVVVTTVG